MGSYLLANSELSVSVGVVIHFHQEQLPLRAVVFQVQTSGKLSEKVKAQSPTSASSRSDALPNSLWSREGTETKTVK